MVSRLSDRVLQAPQDVSQQIVLKIKSIVMPTTNNWFRKVHNYTHFKRLFTKFVRKCKILEIFHYFQYFERFRSMKKMAKSSTGTSISVKSLTPR